MSTAGYNKPYNTPVVNATDGSPLAVTGTFSANTSAMATAAPPSYTEGQSEPLSQDLSGNLRISGSISASTSARATAANPSYSEGTDDNLSQDLSGHLRVMDNTVNTSLGTINTTLGSPFQAGGSIGNTVFQANAGTNLNTSALALESGGNLATLASGISSGKYQVSVTNASLAVTGTFYQTTQPVSIAATVTTSDNHLPATAVLSDTISNPTVSGIGSYLLGWDATNTEWRRVQVDTGTGTLKVDPGTVTVTGTVAASESGIWTVQPGNTANTTPWLSTINQGGNSAIVTASNALKVDGSAITQPISGTVTANAGTNLNTSTLALENGGNLASIKTNTTTTTKGIQPSGLLPTQDAKDSGRTAVVLILDRITGVTTEALATMSINKGGTVVSASFYTVTPGKTLRIQMISLSIADTTTTTVNGRLRLRALNGTVLVTSPVYAALDVAGFPGTAAAGIGVGEENSIPDGLEFASGWEVGLSQIMSSTSSTVSACVIGYEY